MRQSRKKTAALIIALVLITVVSLSITTWTLYFREPKVLTPDYAPPDVEINAQPIIENTEEKLDIPEGEEGIALTFNPNVSIFLSIEQASVMLSNPSVSTQDIIVEVVIQDTILVQSDRITPGNQITVLDLEERAAEMLMPGEYDGKLMIHCYDTKTGKKAVVNTELPVSVKVFE
ncbi:MAG: hypothetical protein IJA67_01770 [Oscillospiraceae bacterium]|nr:hypothetical protein [Oscillospiraceae bacterium]